jgi:hypothetical protein
MKGNYLKRISGRLFLFVLVFVLLGGLSFAQSGSTGALEGKILDEQGSPLPGVALKLTSPDLIGGAQIKMTDGAGHFRFVAIPRGTYTLEASLAGFNPVKKDGIRVFVGQTITLDLTLTIGKLEQEVIVKADAPLIDVKDSQTNVTNLDRQMLETVGEQQRSKTSTFLIELAPGVADESALGAASRTSNQWQVDGQNLLTYIGSGADWSYPDMSIVEEAQISGSGASAEYGNFTGAVLNLVTKSGGNRFEGMASTSYSPLNWNQKNFDPNNPKFSLYEAPPRVLFFDANAGIGGPIVRDRLWFYASAGFIQQDGEIKGFKQRESQKIPKLFGKLTWQPDAANRISFTAVWEKFQIFNRGLSAFRPLIATYTDIGPDLVLSASLLHTFSQNTFAEVKVGRFWALYDQRPNAGKNVSQHLDYVTGLYSGNYGFWGESDTTHYTGSVSLSHHAEDFIKGSHDFKVGVEFLAGNDNYSGGYPGGFSYTDNYYGYTLAYSYDYVHKSKAWKASFFAQDSWKISDRLTLNPGIRFGVYRGSLPNLGEQSVFKPKNPLEPRIGLTWDIFGDHKTALKLHYGRFVDSLKTGYFVGADTGTSDWVMYLVQPDRSKVEISRYSFSDPATVDPNVRMPYSDQFTLGLEHMLTQDLSVSVTLTRRVFKEFIGVVNTGARWIPFTYTYVDEHGASQNIQLYQQDPTSTDSFLITNPKAGSYPSAITTPKNTYDGIILSVSKRFSNKWMFDLSYCYSQAKGNYSNDYSGGTGRLNDHLNPNYQINAYGHLTIDATHNFKLYSSFILPFDISFSPIVRYMTGDDWTRVISVPLLSGAPTVRIEPRGSQRLPARINFDLRIEKTFQLAEKMKVGFYFDCFNVANRGKEIYVDSKVTSVNFGKALYVNEPRYFRVGFRFFF